MTEPTLGTEDSLHFITPIENKWQKNLTGFWCLSPVPHYRTHSPTLDSQILKAAQSLSGPDLRVCCPSSLDAFSSSQVTSFSSFRLWLKLGFLMTGFPEDLIIIIIFCLFVCLRLIPLIVGDFFARTAVKKCHRWDDISNRNLQSHNSGGGKSSI